jgi:enoyl-CoA hydratase/carnithine racemase
VPDTGAGTYLLSRIVGLSNALDLVCSGDIINAQEMLRIGLVSKVVPNDQLMPVAIETAKRFMSGSPLAIRNAKELIYRSLEGNMEEHLQASSSIFSMLTASEDHAEGVKAFMEKREPRWKGK